MKIAILFLGAMNDISVWLTGNELSHKYSFTMFPRLKRVIHVALDIEVPLMKWAIPTVKVFI